MTYPQTSISTPLSVPVAGINKRDPLAAMPQGYALEALNFDPEPQYLRLRKGYVRHGDTGDADDGLLGMGVWTNAGGTKKLYVIGYDDTNPAKSVAWDATTSTLTVDATIGNAITLQKIPFNYDGGVRLAFMWSAPTDDDNMYNGAWGTTGFTYLGNPLDFMRCATVYNGRVYIGGYQSSTDAVFYSATAGVTGALSLWATQTLFSLSHKVYWMGVLTSPTGIAAESFLCIGTMLGEILVYSGDFPGASNWQQVATFKVDDLLNANPPLAVNGDLFLITKTGVVSIRALFQTGNDSLEDAKISKEITPYWTAMIREGLDSGATGAGSLALPNFATAAYWPEQNKCYFLVGGFLDANGTYTQGSQAATMFVYNIVSRGWTWHKIGSNCISSDGTYGGAKSLTYFENSLYYITGNAVMKVSDTVYKDETWNSANTFTGYTYNLESAYTALGQVNTKKRVTGVELLVKTDFNGSNVGVKVASDFGRKVSAVSNQSLQSGYNSVNYSVGVDGTFLQYRLTGTSDTASTQGLELYSVGLNLK
jgi:hypothetical protein